MPLNCIPTLVETQGVNMNFFQTAMNTKSSSDLKTLSRSLSEFGLQPYDWVLIKNSNSQIKIQHKEEPSFYFIGKVTLEKGQKKWNSIHLASL